MIITKLNNTWVVLFDMMDFQIIDQSDNLNYLLEVYPDAKLI